MQFLNAAFLWAGLAALIPLIIHLLNLRRSKTVLFSDVRFLQNMKSVNRRRSSLRSILLLVLRMLAIASLAAAFAEPAITKGVPESQAARKQAPPIIYIDNSQSMQAGAISGLNLETAKQKALEIVDAFPSGTEFLLATNDFEQKHNRLAKAGDLRLLIQDIATSPRVPTISQVIKKSSASLAMLGVDPGASKSIFIVSDFQKNICDFENVEPDTLLQASIVGIESETKSNIAIDTAEFGLPCRMAGSQEEITATICNYGSQPARGVPITLEINGQEKASETFDIGAGQRKQVTLRYVNGGQSSVKGKISIADSPVYFDNDLYFSCRIDSARSILAIGSRESSKYIRALLGHGNGFSLTEKESLDGASLQDYQCVILSQLKNIPRAMAAQIQAYVSAGGSAIFIPAEDGSISDYNYLLSLLECNQIISPDTIRCKISSVNTSSSLLRGALKQMPENPDMPYVHKYFSSMSNPYQGEEIVLETDSYKKMMTANAYRAGMMFVFYTPLSERCGSLATHRLIVPLMYNAACASQNFGQQYYSVIGRSDGYSIKLEKGAEAREIKLKDEESGNEYIPRISGPDSYMNYKFFADELVEKPGFLTLTGGGSRHEALAFNFDRRESRMEFYSAQEAGEMLGAQGIKSVRVMGSQSVSFASEAAQSAQQEPLWKIFVVLFLTMSAAEIAVARFM